MRRLLFIALLFAVAFSRTSAFAGSCDNAQDQATMNGCADKSFQASDAELNTLYKQIRHRLQGDPDTTRLLVSAQKAWIAYRDAECAFSGSSASGGTVYPMLVAQCREGVTDDRIKNFKRYLSCEEGDMSCPVPAAD